MGRVSVPLWGIILSDPLPVIALVSHYLTNKLIGNRLLPDRYKPLLLRDYQLLAHLSAGYDCVGSKFLFVTHPFATVAKGDRSTCMR